MTVVPHGEISPTRNVLSARLAKKDVKLPGERPSAASVEQPAKTERRMTETSDGTDTESATAEGIAIATVNGTVTRSASAIGNETGMATGSVNVSGTVTATATAIAETRRTATARVGRIASPGEGRRLQLRLLLLTQTTVDCPIDLRRAAGTGETRILGSGVGVVTTRYVTIAADILFGIAHLLN